MVYDFTEAVVIRPKMYTLLGSYPEVIAFLEGYYSGLSKGRSNAVIVENWYAFRQWLAEKLDASISDEFKVLVDKHEPTPLEAFICFYQEFKTSNGYIQN